MWRKIILTLSVITAVAFATTACTKRMETHGSIVKQDRIDRVKVGMHTRNDVAELLGSPSAVGTFNDKRWYYYTEKASIKPLGSKNIVEREIVIIDFDPQGKVSAMSYKTKDDAQNLSPSKKTTATHGQTLGIIDQFLDNVGKGL
tara:strand:+ start:31224 stop:31658 length:435 start_codon:yes stop_codon:yes gene_type:complete